MIGLFDFAKGRLTQNLNTPCNAPQRVAIAATWLASKLEEAPKKFKDMLLVFTRIDSRAEGRAPELLDPSSQVRPDSGFSIPVVPIDGPASHQTQLSSTIKRRVPDAGHCCGSARWAHT